MYLRFEFLEAKHASLCRYTRGLLNFLFCDPTQAVFSLLILTAEISSENARYCICTLNKDDTIYFQSAFMNRFISNFEIHQYTIEVTHWIHGCLPFEAFLKYS